VKNKDILVIAPVFDEEGKIGKVVNNVKKHLGFDILVVNDCSKDKSNNEAKKEGAIVVSHKVRKGVGATIRTGINFAIQKGYKIAVIISGGGKNNVFEVPHLLKPIINNNFDFVQGSRYKKGGKFERMPVHRIIGTKLYSILFSIISHTSISDASSGFRAFKISILNDKKINLWQEWLNKYELEPYLLYKVLQLKYKFKEVPVTIQYPYSKPYTKMKKVKGWWSITKPIIYLSLGIKK